VRVYGLHYYYPLLQIIGLEKWKILLRSDTKANDDQSTDSAEKKSPIQEWLAGGGGGR
jgi:hypothetical protein